MDLNHLEQQQQQLAAAVTLHTTPDGGYVPKPKDVLCSLDIQYVEQVAYVAADLRTWQGEPIGVFGSILPVLMPYVPQFFAFREAPLLCSLVESLRKQVQIHPNCLLIDGHGIAHPRKFGVACAVGLQTQLPSIGCAKETLLTYQGELASPRGSTLPIMVGNQTVGVVLRTQPNIRPVFVSVGNDLSLQTATQMVLNLASTYRIAEPLRNADQAARALAKGETKNINLLE